MKGLIIAGIALVALGGTWEIAQELRKEGHSGVPGMTKDMMQESQPADGSRAMMQGMGGMMGMMKMMEQCNDMMKSMQQQAEKAKETQKK